MSESIPAVSVTESSGSDGVAWGNAWPILHEIRHALRRLVDRREPTLVDLLAIPFGPGDEARLLSLLGRGEIEATLEALGRTQIWETAIPGVWLVDHRNAEDERVALHVEVSTVPAILHTQIDDLRGAEALLDARIAAGVDR